MWCMCYVYVCVCVCICVYVMSVFANVCMCVYVCMHMYVSLRHCSASPQPLLTTVRWFLLSAGCASITWLLNLCAPSCGVTWITDVPLEASAGLRVVRSIPHPFFPFPQEIMPQFLLIVSVQTPFMGLSDSEVSRWEAASVSDSRTPLPFTWGHRACSPPNPLSTLSSVSMAAASCSSANIHSGSRRLIFLSYKYTQIWVVSLDLGEWLEQPQLIHHHKDGRERLSHHEYSAMPLWLCPPLLVLSLHRLSHGMNRGASGLCVQWWILVHPTTSGKSSLNTPVAPPNLLTDTHQLVYSTLP